MDAAFQVTERRCKICTSKNRDAVDAMLMGEMETPDGKRYRYADIVDYLGAHGETVSESGLSRHYAAHLMPSMRAFLETQKNMEALAKATGKKLSLHSTFANIVTSKVLRQLDEMGEEALNEVSIDKLIKLGLLAGRNGLHLEKTEALLTKKEVVQEIDGKLAKEGVSAETRARLREAYGLES